MINTILLQATEEGGGGGFQQIILFGGIALVFYFFMIRPQQKKAKEQKKFIQEIKKGDLVITAGGVHGKVLNTDDTMVVLEVDKGVKMTFQKSSVSSNVVKEDSADKKS